MTGQRRLAAIILACGGALYSADASVSSAEVACGRVIAVECRTETGRVQLVISKAGASEPVQVELDTQADTDGLAAESRYLFKSVCVSKDQTTEAFAGDAPPGVTITGPGSDPADSPRRAARLCDLAITPPRLTKHVNPIPSAEAQAHQKVGTVWLDVLVDDTGRVADARVTHSIDREYGGDASAVATVKQWAFSPATRNGRPIAVVVTVLITFTITR
jgi:TonB family protein